LNKEDSAFLSDLRIHYVVTREQAQPFQQRLISEGALKARSSVLDEPVKKDQCSDLPMRVAILTKNQVSALA
jgi:hypothetical protein